jgi:hypothetical protein
MKKTTTLFILALCSVLYVNAQNNSGRDTSMSYHEIKEAGLSHQYTPEELTRIQLRDAHLITEQESAASMEMNAIRSNDPPLPSTQTTTNAFTITPQNPSVCQGQTVTLSASNSFTYSTAGLYIADDMWSSPISLPFSFSFYGNSYSQCIISTNGSIGFNMTYANWWSSWWNWIYTQPNIWPADIRNTFGGPWIDLYLPISGTCRYATVGTAPNRIFVVEFCNASYWWCWYTYYFSGQMLLYEGSNVLETHIIDRPPGCWWIGSSHAIHSTENSSGTVAAVVPGRNAPDVWSTATEGKRWTWNTSTLNYDITSITYNPVPYYRSSSDTTRWYNSSNVLVGTGATYTVPSSLPVGTHVYYATITASRCAGTILYTAYDTVTVYPANLPAPTASNDTICIGQSTSLSASCGGNCLWYTQSSGGSPIGTGIYTTPNLSSTTTYYVGYSSGSCNSARTAVSVVIGPTLAAPTATSSAVCDANIATTLTANCGNNCQWYTQSTGGTPVGGGSPFTTIPPTTTYYVENIDAYGCTSPRTQATVTVGNLAVTANTSVNCPSGSQSLIASATGMTLVNASVQNSTPSGGAPNNGIDCTLPSDLICANNYDSLTIITPANVSNPMTTSSIQSVYLHLFDIFMTGGGAVGADAQLWLKSPAGTFLLLADNRPYNSDFDSNTCYCPTFTYAGTDGLLSNMDGPYDELNYLPDGGLLSFAGENPYVNGGVWTLYLVDPDDWSQGSFGFLEIIDFEIVFGTYPPSTYSWTSSGTCGTLSSSSVSNPIYNPPSISGNYTCNYTVTVNNGGCTGTASVNLGCNTLPVELLSYTGRNIPAGNHLNWITATETNNKYFTLERSTDGLSFSFIGKTDSRSVNGNSTTSLTYSFLDKDVKPGTYYYRLSQTDIDGTTRQNGTIAIHVKNKKEVLSVVPNPTATVAEITYDCYAEENATLKVLDHAGNIIMVKGLNCSTGENKYLLDISAQPDGIYLITVSTNDEIYKARLIKSQ